MMLFLDDDPERCRFFKTQTTGMHRVITHTATECIDELARDLDQFWNIVFLDHDLGGMQFVPSNEHSGMEVVRWIIATQPKIRRIIVHSHNRPAAEEMVRKLNDAKYDAIYIPYAILKERLQLFFKGIKHGK